MDTWLRESEAAESFTFRGKGKNKGKDKGKGKGKSYGAQLRWISAHLNMNFRLK